MKISSPKNYTAFKGANVSINAISDTHGCLNKLDKCFCNMEENKFSIFLPEASWNKNVLIIDGDWFISGAQKGYRTNPKANFHDFQARFFNEFITRINKLQEGITTYFIPGNHEFDGGEDEFKRVSNLIDAKILMSNLDIEASPLLQEEIGANKIVQKDILEIDDDKNPDLTHKVLFVGVNPVNMPYYKKGMKGINFLNQPFKNQKSLSKEDYKESLEAVKKTIVEFKKENPKGLVIASIHTGAEFSENLAKELGPKNLDLIFDGHEHKDGIKDVNGVKIVRLSQNFNKYANVRFKINDDGHLEETKIQEFYPQRETKGGGFFDGFYAGLFYSDLLCEYKIQTGKTGLKSLEVDGVRSGNNYLANFITDSILSQIQKTNPEVEIFTINASAIRAPLSTDIFTGENNLSVLCTLNGIVAEDAGIFKNEITGEELTKIILDNLLFNEKAPERNPILQHSGLIINKTQILKEYKEGAPLETLARHIIATKTGEAIDLEKTYTVTNVEKFFKKSKLPLIKDKMQKEAIPLDLNAKILFAEFMQENKGQLFAKCDERYI